MSVAVDIFVVSCKAVAKVFIIAAVGVAARRNGLLDAPTCKSLAKVNGRFFLPALLFTAIGRSVTLEHLKNVWLLPLSACMNISLGALMGALLVRVVDVPRAFRGPAVAASAFGNSLALPVVLIAAVVSAGDVGHLTFTEENQAEALLYLGAYMTTLTLLMWTFGPVWMRSGDDDDARGAGSLRRRPPDAESEVELATAPAGRSEARDEERRRGGAVAGHSASEDEEDHASVALVSGARAARIDKRPLDPSRARDDSDSSPAGRGVSGRGVSARIRRLGAALAPAANANVAASLLGTFVGLVPPLRAALFEPDGVLFLAQDCASILAAAAVPQVIVLLGASLAAGPEHDLCSRRLAAGVGAIRLACIPAVNVGVFLALRAALPASAVPASPVFWLVFLVEGATPTANNMMLQAEMYARARGVSAGIGAALFWQYVAAPIALTGAISLFLAII